MRALLCVSLLSVCTVPPIVAAQEAVKFDSRRLFSCAEVKSPQNADTARKVVVIVIPVSANFSADESTVEVLHSEFRFPKSVTILDHFPKTQTGTDIAGLTEQQGQERQVTDLNVQYGGDGRVNFSLWGVGVTAGGGAERKERKLNEVETNIKSAHLPPRGQVVVAGTADEGQTLYFDLKWFNQITRAGQTDYVFLAEVPKDWKGDIATLACNARQSGTVVGRLTKPVGLYLSGSEISREHVEKLLETARPSVPEEKEVVTNSIGTRLKLIPAGSFLRGATSNDTDAEEDEKPQRKVTITRPFYLGVYEITQYEYRQVMNDNPSKFKDSELLPVEQVSWLDAVNFCNKLSEREGRKPYYKIDDKAVTIQGGNGYRLPTEAEWEYACRAPQSPETKAKHPFGEDDGSLKNYAWFGEDLTSGKTHPVGQKKPNRWGLYDMQGNVWEWCQDWYSNIYYTVAPENDPPGPLSASHRVWRGGGWLNGARNCRPADRITSGPDFRNAGLGFRIAADQ